MCVISDECFPSEKPALNTKIKETYLKKCSVYHGNDFFDFFSSVRVTNLNGMNDDLQSNTVFKLKTVCSVMSFCIIIIIMEWIY